MSDDDDSDFVASPVKSSGKRKRLVDDKEDDDEDDDIYDSSDDKPLKPKKKTKIKIRLSNSSATSTKVKKKKVKTEVTASPVVSSSHSAVVKKTTKKTVTVKKEKKLKELDKTERLQYALQSYLWWEAPVLEDGVNWKTMEHAGVSFPEEYQPHGVKMLYDGQPVSLTPAQEEAATFFAAMDPEGMHLGNPKTAPIFIKNFMQDFKAILGKKHVIQKFEKCDFEPIRRHLNEQKIIKKAITDEQKKANKEDRNQVLHKFGYALVDGHIERVGEYQ